MNRRPATTEELLSHADWVRRLSRALLSDPNAAEDVAQDAWVAALKRRPTAGDGMRAWWSRVVHSAASNHRRSALRRADREQRVASERVEATDPTVESTLDAHRRLAAAIDALEEPLRDVIVEHYFHGSSSREIAEREGVADSTIRTRLQKALERLRHQLDEHSGGDRQAWAGLLAPLAKLETRVLPAAAAAVVIAGWMKVAAGVALVGIAGLAVYRFVDSPHDKPGAEGSVRESAVATAPHELSESVSTVRRVESPAPPTAEPSVAPSTQEELVATVEARVLDSRGLALRGARLQLIDRSETHESTDEEAPHGLTDGTGRVSITIGATDRSKRRAQRAGLDANTWDALFAVSCNGYATRRLTATTVLGRATSLGDVMLSEGADLRGRCVRSDGAALTESRVYLIHPDLTLAEREGARRGMFRTHDELIRVSCSSDGTFMMHGVPPGTFRVRGSSKGLAQSLSDPFTVAIGDEYVVPDLVLPECVGVIRGTLLLPDGSPCSRGWIQYIMNDRGEWTDRKCAPDGTFLLDRSEATLVDLCAKDSRDEFGQVLLRGVQPGQSGLVLRLPPPRSIEIRVTDSSGVPIQEFAVGVFHMDDFAGRSDGIRSAEGVGTIHALARPFRVRVEATGYSAEERAPLQQDDAPRVLEFKLRPGALVRGRVLFDGVAKDDSPVELHELRAEPRTRLDGMPDLVEDELSRASYSDGEGAFAIGSAHEGRFALVATTRSGMLAFARVLDLSVAHPVEGIIVDLADTGSIEGHVEGLDPDDIRPLHVIYSCGIDNPRFEQVNPVGTFRIAGLAPGPWWLRLTRSTRTEFGLLPVGLTIESPNLKRVVVDARSAARCDFDLRIDEARIIEGRVLLDGRAPQSWIADVRGQGASDERRSSTAIAADGTFRLPVSDFGLQTLSLRSPGQADRDDSIEAQVTVPNDGLRWTLQCEFGAVDVQGPPSAKCQVQADLPNGATWTTHAILDANGRATLDSLPAAKARVSFAGSTGSPIDVEIPAHGRTQVRLP